MPLFRLNAYLDELCSDPEGSVLTDAEAAKRKAIRSVRELVAAEVNAGNPVHQSYWVEVADEAGEVLHIVRFGDVLQLVP